MSTPTIHSPTEQQAQAQTAITAATAAISEAETAIVNAAKEEENDVTLAVYSLNDARNILRQARLAETANNYVQARLTAVDANVKAIESVKLITPAKKPGPQLAGGIAVALVLLIGVMAVYLFLATHPRKKQPGSGPAQNGPQQYYDKWH